jgi:2-isopropylmalate synthase
MIRKKAAPVLFREVINANRELNILHSLKAYEPPFRILRTFHLVDNGSEPEATVVLEAGGKEIHEADTGVGPVDALANALKKALKPAFSFVEEVKLIDFSARIFESRSGTQASVEVSVWLSDGTKVWTVSEASQNINVASFHALAGGYEFAILQRRRSFLERVTRPSNGKKADAGVSLRGKKTPLRKAGSRKGLPGAR